MQQLTTIKRQSPTLEAALETPALIEAEESQALNEIYRAISYVRILKNSQTSKADLQTEAALLYNEIKEQCGGLKIGEIFLALKKGVLGEFGEYYGLNIVSYLDWLQSWRESEAVRQAKRSVRKPAPVSRQIEAPKTLTPEQESDLLNFLFRRWRKYGELEDYGSLAFKILTNRGELEDFPSVEDTIDQAQKEKIKEVQRLCDAGFVTLTQAKKLKEQSRDRNSFLVRKEAEKILIIKSFEAKLMEIEFEKEPPADPPNYLNIQKFG